MQNKVGYVLADLNITSVLVYYEARMSSFGFGAQGDCALELRVFHQRDLFVLHPRLWWGYVKAGECSLGSWWQQLYHPMWYSCPNFKHHRCFNIWWKLWFELETFSGNEYTFHSKVNFHYPLLILIQGTLVDYQPCTRYSQNPSAWICLESQVWVLSQIYA